MLAATITSDAAGFGGRPSAPVGPLPARSGRAGVNHRRRVPAHHKLASRHRCASASRCPRAAHRQPPRQFWSALNQPGISPLLKIIPASGPGITPSHPPTEAGIVTRWLQNYWVRRSAMQDRSSACRSGRESERPTVHDTARVALAAGSVCRSNVGSPGPAGSAGIRSPPAAGPRARATQPKNS